MRIMKLIPLMIFVVIVLLLTGALSVNALPLNVDLKQKITAEVVPNGVYLKSLTRNNVIYVPDKQGSTLTAISVEDQSVNWVYNTGETSEVREMVFANDMIIVATSTKVFAIHSQSGTLQWSANYSGASFANDSTTLYLVAGKNVVALDLVTGNQRWSYAVSARENLHSSLAIGEGKVFFTTDNQLDMVRKMYALDLNSSQVMWTTTNVDYYSKKPVYRDGKIYLNFYKEMYAYSAQTGAVLWKFEIAPNFTFEMSNDTIYTRTSDGYLSAYDKETKALRWKTFFVDRLYGGVTVNSSKGPMIITQQYVIIENNGKLKWYETATGNLKRQLVEPGEKIIPVTAEEQVLLASDGLKGNLYVYAPATDSVKPNVILDKVTTRFSPYEGGMEGRIDFLLTENSYVTVYVKNELGKVIRVLNLELLNKGWNEANWDGKTTDGDAAQYGKYTYVFYLKDFAGNDNWLEDSTKKTVLGDIFGTTVQEITAKKAADVNAENLMIIPKDKRVTILSESTNWYHVYFDLNSQFYTGYVEKSVLSTRSNPITMTPPEQPQPFPSIVHTVQAGDALWKISVKYNVTVQAIVDANKLDPTKYLSVGQKLTIPVQQTEPVTPELVHTVQAGDTLWKVSVKYNLTIQEIVDENKLDPTKYLSVGQKLTIPVKQTQPVTPALVHTVQAGDTLWKIAIHYNTTTQKIIDVNKLDPAKYLYVGQKLTIPSN